MPKTIFAFYTAATAHGPLAAALDPAWAVVINRQGVCPLHQALRNRRVDMALLLIPLADVNAPIEEPSWADGESQNVEVRAEVLWFI